MGVVLFHALSFPVLCVRCAFNLEIVTFYYKCSKRSTRAKIATLQDKRSSLSTFWQLQFQNLHNQFRAVQSTVWLLAQLLSTTVAHVGSFSSQIAAVQLRKIRKSVRNGLQKATFVQNTVCAIVLLSFCLPECVSTSYRFPVKLAVTRA